MIVNSNGVTAGVVNTQPPATAKLDYNSFLTMLVTELKTQDPTKPMDATQMVSQIATISGVSQAVQTNATLASLLTATSLNQAEQLIGKTVTSADGLTSGAVQSVTVDTSGATATLQDGSVVPLTNGVNISAP